jgi:hypothetical protein
MAAVVAILVGIGFSYGLFHGANDRYAAYRKRMVETALKGYSMDVTTSNRVQIHDFLAANHAPADYPVTPGLKKAALVGCAVSTWQDNPVSMICFKSGRPLSPGTQSDLWLFVTGHRTLAKANLPANPVIDRVNKAITASWSDGHNDYLLAAVGDEALLRKYLQ